MKPGFHQLIEMLEAQVDIYENSLERNGFKTVTFKNQMIGRIAATKEAISIAQIVGKD